MPGTVLGHHSRRSHLTMRHFLSLENIVNMLYFGSSILVRREKSRDFAQHLEFLKPSYDFPLTFTHYVFAPRTLITYDWNFRFYYADVFDIARLLSSA